MKYQLREYQKECITTIKEHFKTKKSQLIQLPTGAGKTWIFLNYLRDNSKNSLIICPSRELKEQIFQFGKVFLKDPVYAKITEREWKYANHYVITAHSLTRPETFEYFLEKDFDHIVVDEAHHAMAPSYLRFIENYQFKNPNTKLLGCTATPERLDKECLLDLFTELTFKRNLVNLINEGFLANVVGYKLKTKFKPDSFKNSTQNGDFRPSFLKLLDVPSRNKIITDCIEENCLDKKTLIFCLNVDHAIQIAHLLKEKGFSASHIHGEMAYRERQSILLKFKSGEIKYLTNCQLLTEGFDEPTIQALVIARPTKSKALYFQMLGRGVRKSPGKDICYLYELADNLHDICTFNVAAGKDEKLQRDYRQGIKLTELKEELDLLNIDDIELEKEEFKLAEILDKKGEINVFESWFYKIPAYPHQIKILKNKAIYYHEDITYLEASFLIWKEKLRVKYGEYHRKK